MGLRHRSIRLRVGVLITVPVLCLLALYGFILAITLGSALSQEHAKALRNDVADPVTAFQQQVAQERALAILSLADPTDTSVASQLGLQESATQRSLVKLTAAMQSPSVTSLSSDDEQAAINHLLKVTRNLNYIRGVVADNAIPMRTALADYDAVINAGYPVIDEAADQLSDVSIVTQAIDILDLDRASQATQAEWDLLQGDITQHKFPNADRLTFAALANQRQSLINIAVPDLDSQYRALVARNVPPTANNAIDAAESAVIDTPWHHGMPPPRLGASKMVFFDYSASLGKALSETADALETQVQSNTDTVVLELVLAAGLGLLGTAVSIALSLIIGRGLIRQLRELRESALTLAHEKLPDVVTRLRSGEQVDLAGFAAPEVDTSNEIEQVQNAFTAVQQTAVQAAVDEARLRRGISDVFRNLAGRSQSLLHRQLTLLDGMERRATEPDELEDLFRIDHLTTRMRRHAEGLIILSGETPARGWRQPVPLVDVLRAAVAEVEDYTRIRVLCRTSAAVAGHAVADVIHLVAELAENATVFSPPNTPVRIQGDVVGRGFAVEIEDRGLGISEARLEEINAHLANPPQFDLSGSDRLGLFIAGQLAQRHDIKITLRPSVYGGTTAIVLIPTALVVDDGSVERDRALVAAQDEMALAEGLGGRHAALAQSGAGAGLALPGPAGNGLTGNGLARNGLSGIGAVSYGEARYGEPGFGGANYGDASNTSTGNGAGSVRPADYQLAENELTGGFANAERNALAGASAASEAAAGDFTSANSPSGSFATESVVSDSIVSGPVAEAVTGSGAGPANAPWATGGADSDQGPNYFARGFSLGGRATPPESPVAGNSDPRVLTPVSDDSEPAVSKADVTQLGLPVRVRQANLAPQLRNTPPPAPPSQTGFGGSRFGRAAGSGGPVPPAHADPAEAAATQAGPPATGGPQPASPEAARNTVSALQRGWQLGRSVAAAGDPAVPAFLPRRSPSGRSFSPVDADADRGEQDPVESADELSDEHDN